MTEKDIETGLEIAVIGMAGKFPGANNIDAFWDNLKNGVEAISFFSDAELDEAGIDPALIENPDFVKTRGGILEGIEYFDASFFDYIPMEAEQMAPQIRIFHECLWEAFEDAGYDPKALNRDVGLYTGVSSTYNWEMLSNFSSTNKNMTPFVSNYLNNRDYLSTLISYKFDLKGPSFSMHTACSSSLVAIHLGCQGLLSGDCDMAMAGGISLQLSDDLGYVYEEGMIVSPDGHCRAFDARAKGTIGGDGVGVAALKRLADAIEDRDNIYAVIKGSAVNNDGSRKVGFAAPGIDGQSGVIKKAYRMAEVNPEDIAYVEAHGTATPLGDVTEVEALKLAFNTGKRHFCALGSVKANVGHLNNAAGAAGFIKTVLVLKHKQIPPALHFEIPNPGIDFENNPFYVNTEPMDWKNDGRPMRAGVSSFGIGGTNAHVVLEEWHTAHGAEARGEPPRSPEQGREYQLLLLSAKTESALDALTEKVAQYLKKDPHINLADAAYTLQVGRRHFPYRRKLVCANVREAVAGLVSPDSRNVQTFLAKSMEDEQRKPVIFMFPGLGSQYVNMGLGLYKSEPVFRKELDTCFRILEEIDGIFLKDILYPGGNGEEAEPLIQRTDISQYVIFVFEYALARLLMSWGIAPRAMIGYSFGEYVAACLSGVFTLEDALKLMVARGKLLQRLPAGRMLSVPLPKKDLQPLLTGELSIGIDNGSSCVVSGSLEAVESFEKQVKEKRLMCMYLDSGHAIHSTMMEPILKDLEAEVGKISLQVPQIPYISTVTGSWIKFADAASPGYWARQLRETVQFAEGIRELLKEPDAVFLEVGPGWEVSALVKREIEAGDKTGHQVVNLVRHRGTGTDKKDMPDAYYLLDKIGLLWLYGVSVNWRQYRPEEKRCRISLPTYPFERHRFWGLADEYEAEKRSGFTGIWKSAASKELSDWFYVPSWMRRKIFTTCPQKEDSNWCWLVFTDNLGLGEALIAGLKGHRVITVKAGPAYEEKRNDRYIINPGQYEDYEKLLAKLTSKGDIPNRMVHLWGISANDRDGIEPEFVRQCSDLGFYSLLYLSRALGRNRHIKGKIEINVVTDNMQEVTGDENLSPGKATVMGPCKVIPQEYPNIICRSIDVTDFRDMDIIERLLGEIACSAEDTDRVVAFRGNRRWVQTFEPLRLEGEADSPLLRQGGVYLVIGGLGDIGGTLVEYLIESVGARVIIAGRSQLPPREMWTQFLILNDEKDRVYRYIRKLQQFEEHGEEGCVFYCSADVSDRFQLQEAIRQGEERFGPINGVIHAAGTISAEAFNTIDEISLSQCRMQFQAKQDGLLVLEELLKDKALDFCLLVSSIAAILGGLEFVAYSAANHFMDAFAAKCNQRKREPWIIVDWDGTNKEETRGAFHRIFSSDSIEQVIFSVGGDLEGRISRWVKLEEMREDDKGKREDEAVLYSRPELSNPYVAPRNAAEQKLADIWQRFFGMDKIGVTDDLYDLGGDSLKAINIISIIHKELNVVIPIKEFFNYSTIEGVARYLKDVEEDEFIPVVPVEKKEYYELSPAQKRLYILQEMEKSSIAYNSPLVFSVAGGFLRERMQQAVRRLMQRHESLRTCFRMVNGEPVQLIGDTPAVDYVVEYDDETGAEETLVTGIIEDFVRPFDLSRAPCFRLKLVQVETDRDILMFDIHHIITDGVSHEVFVREIAALYRGEELFLCLLQYKDYAEWQNRPQQQSALEKQKTYWLNQFQGKIPVLNLPIDYTRPVLQGFEGRTVGFGIDEEGARGLKKLAVAEDVTLYMVLLAIYNVFLAKVTGQGDVVVGTGAAGRRHSDFQHIIGIFVNTLAVRNYPVREKTFSEFLKEVRGSALDAFENQEYPFEDLVDNLAVKRDTSRNPLFDTMFMLQNVAVQEVGPPESGLQLQPYGYEGRISKFDLTLFGEEASGELYFSFEYSTKLFKRETIDLFIIYFKEIAAAVASAPNKALREIETISNQRREAVIYGLNRQMKEEVERFTDTAGSLTLQQRLNDGFGKFHHRPAIESGNRTMTYEDLDRKSGAVADWIRNKGIPGQTVIGILLENRMDFISVMIGILKARCIFVPMDSAYPRVRLETMVSTAGMEFIITDPENAPQWPDIFPAHPDYCHGAVLMGMMQGERDGRYAVASSRDYSPEDIIYIYFTSGTTGTPRAMKGVNRSLLHFIFWEIETFGVNETFRFSQFTTPVFDAFLRDVFVPLCAGGVICIPPHKETILHPQQLIGWVQTSGLDLIHCVPGLFRLLTSPEYLEQNDFKALKYILLSGERIEPSDLAGWYGIFGERIQLVNLWGTSETTLAKTAYFIRQQDIHRERIPVGKPLPGAQVVVLDENREICDVLVTGELYIKTPFRTAGYCHEPELNKQRFIPDPFKDDDDFDVLLHKTGDQGRILPDGNIDVLGRNDRQVKIRGIRVELEEIESVLIKHPAVSEAVAVKKEISRDNALLCAYVVLTPLTEEDASLSGIKEQVSGYLPDYMVPDKITVIEKIPRKPSGKVDYDELPDPLAEEKFVLQPPRDKIEEKLRGLWVEILGIEAIGIHSSFFELGGNSLNIMTLISRIHREFDVRIFLGEIFNNPTIEKQAAIIRGNKEGEYAAADKYASVEAAEEREYYPVSSMQKRLYILDGIEGIGTAYNISQSMVGQGEFKEENLAKAFQLLVDRHESLRTSFHLINGEIVQKVHRKVDVKLQHIERELGASSSSSIEQEIKNFIKPFDLAEAPLLRIGIGRLEQEEFLLLFDTHHIISDGTSMSILARDIVELYEGRELPLLRIQYKDFCHWRNTGKGKTALKKQESYWLERFKGERPVLEMPTDYPRPQVQRFQGKSLTFALEKEIKEKIDHVMKETGATLYMVLLAGFNILLSRYTGQEDIAVGTPIAGREHVDFENLIGLFINALPIRNYPKGDKTFKEFLREVKENTLNAYENQAYQFGELIEALNIQKDLSRNPLFDVELVLHNYETEAREVEELEFALYGFDPEVTQVDIAFNGKEFEDMILFSVTYCTELFKQETVERMITFYRHILSTTAANVDIKLEEIKVSHDFEAADSMIFKEEESRFDF